MSTFTTSISFKSESVAQSATVTESVSVLFTESFFTSFATLVRKMLKETKQLARMLIKKYLDVIRCTPKLSLVVLFNLNDQDMMMQNINSKCIGFLFP